MFRQFVRLQDKLLEFVERCEAMILQDDPTVPELPQLRWQFCRALQEYELYLHNNVLAQIIRRRPDRAREAAALKADPIAPVYRAHVMKWSTISPADHWQEYRNACLDGLPRLCERLSRDRAAVAELLGIWAPAQKHPYPSRESGHPTSP